MAQITVPLAEDLEDSEFTVPAERLRAAGHRITVIGRAANEVVTGKRGKARVTVDANAEDVDPDDFDTLVIPGGYSPDHLRIVPSVVSFVKRFCATGKLVAAVCHGPQLLIEADAVRGRTATSWPSVRKDLENAGARWVDREVVEDGTLITSRKPDDLEAFSQAIVRRLGGARTEARA